MAGRPGWSNIRSILAGVSASDRNKRVLPKPRLVWVVWDWSTGPKAEPMPGLLLEWRKVEREGRPDRWEGLVLFATGGGERRWSVRLEWVIASELRPIDP